MNKPKAWEPLARESDHKGSGWQGSKQQVLARRSPCLHGKPLPASQGEQARSRMPVPFAYLLNSIAACRSDNVSLGLSSSMSFAIALACLYASSPIGPSTMNLTGEQAQSVSTITFSRGIHNDRDRTSRAAAVALRVIRLRTKCDMASRHAHSSLGMFRSLALYSWHRREADIRDPLCRSIGGH